MNDSDDVHFCKIGSNSKAGFKILNPNVDFHFERKKKKILPYLGNYFYYKSKLCTILYFTSIDALAINTRKKSLV